MIILHGFRGPKVGGYLSLKPVLVLLVPMRYK